MTGVISPLIFLSLRWSLSLSVGVDSWEWDFLVRSRVHFIQEDLLCECLSGDGDGGAHSDDDEDEEYFGIPTMPNDDNCQ